MLPFVLLLTPILIRAVATAFPSIVPEDVYRNSLKEELPQKTLSLALLVPGAVMFLTGLMLTFTPMGDQMIAFFKAPTATLVQAMFYVSGIALIVIGLFAFVLKRK